MVKLSIYGDVDTTLQQEYLEHGTSIEFTVTQDEEDVVDNLVSLGITSVDKAGYCYPCLYVQVYKNNLVELAKAIIKLYGDE